MRIIYFDIDTLRADHVGCYGYARDTTPHIDAIAAQGVRFENTYASDTPCLPSRTALSSGRFGTRTGVVGHGGTAAEPQREGKDRGFRSRAAMETWASMLQSGGLWTASISTFPERHSAYHFLAGFNEWYNLGSRGLETADQVAAATLDWLERNAAREHWFLHVHLWDPHTPYRTPPEFGEPFVGSATPAWLTEEVRAAHWTLPGPHSAQELSGFGPRSVWETYPRQPQVADDMDAVRRVFDGYDTGVRYADQHIGRVMDSLRARGIEEETAVIVTSDHGETLGELGIYCDHQTADQHVCRVPMIVRWPGIAPGVDRALRYQFDVAATVLQLLGLEIPASWDAYPFPSALGDPGVAGRECLVLTHGAWTAQRSVRFDDWICLWTYHDSFHGFPPVMLFDVVEDPHEQRDLATAKGSVVEQARGLLQLWLSNVLGGSAPDPLETVLAEGGPWHARLRPEWYPAYLRDTGRGHWAEGSPASG